MKERQVVTKALCGKYRRARKGERSRMLDEFLEMTGYNRCYARRLLRNHGRRVEVAPGWAVEGDVRLRGRRGRKKHYGPAVLTALKTVWEILDYVCGKRLKAALPELVVRLEACRELRLNKKVRQQLLTMSAATIDRLLAPERRKYALQSRSRTKPGTLLKHHIAVKTFADWSNTRPGFVEIDLVGHDGGTARGEYCQTLNITDVATGWTEQAAVLNKAQIHVFEAIKALRQRLPFDLLGLDSDNGAEFINDQLRRYCEQEHLTLTRSRTQHKNDTCYVEQKNWTLVRRFVGYARYEGLQDHQVLNELYGLLHDYNNFFFPSMKLKEKTRDGARTHKRYHPAKTPYQQVLESPHIDSKKKARLRAHYQTLNPAALRRRIRTLQQRLARRATRTKRRGHAA